ncbi:membrane hypothetical protein [Vibrio chagasii]|nr:membrane hypothetical protein [Vibrio chagasii]
MSSTSDYERNWYTAIILIIVASCLSLFTMYSLLFIILILLFCNTRWALYGLAISVSFYIAILSFLNNPLGSDIGDVVRVYESYNYINDFGGGAYFVEQAKYFRYIVFKVLSFLDLEPNIYTLLCVFTSYLCLYLSLINVTNDNEMLLKSIFSKMIFILVPICLVPFSIFHSYENITAISIFSYALTISQNNNKRKLILFFLSILVHSVSVIYVSIYYFVKVKQDRNMFKKISLTALFLLILSISMVFFNSYINEKVTVYILGQWSYYSRFTDKVYFFQFAVTTLMIFFIWRKLSAGNAFSPNSIYIKIIPILILLSIFIIYFRTPFFRASLALMIISVPIVFLGAIKKDVYTALLSFLVLCISIFSYGNSSFVLNIIDREVGPDFLLIRGFVELFEYKLIY